jgi:Manganese containing catalase
MYHHVKKLIYTVRVDEPDPRFGNMLLEQFGGANGELAAAMQYSIQGLNCEDAARKDLLMDIGSVGIAIDAVNKTEEMQEHFPERPPIVRKVGTRRCYQCNGRFGLVRYELINKTFCSKRCFDKYTGQTIAHQLLGLGAGEWLIFILGITLVGLWVASAIEQSAEFREAAYGVFGAFQ